MKKLLVLMLIMVMTVPFFAVAPAAFASADNISIDLAVTANTVEQTDYRRITYKVTNHGAEVGVKISMYFDGTLILSETPDYVMLSNQTSGCVDVYLPYLDDKTQHSVVSKVNCSNGHIKEETLSFSSVSGQTAGLRFMHCPETVDIGGEIPLALEVTMPLADTIYNLHSVIEINGVRYQELGRTQPVTSGQIIYFVIPGDYTNADLEEISLKIIANPDAMLGEPTGSLSINIPMTGPAGQRKQVLTMVNPVKVSAYIIRNTSAYDYASLTGYRTTIPGGTYVTYLNPDNHNSMRAAKIRTSDGAVYWVPMSNIWITDYNYTIPDTLTKEQKEYFVNAKGYSSETPYLIWVNIERQILCVFTGSQGNWQMVDCFPVATGTNKTPTPTVEHKIEYVTRWVTPSYTCYPVLALYDGYALHNQPVSPRGYVTDTTIGSPASAGCVRMLQKDIDKVHSYVPVHTNVVIY